MILLYFYVEMQLTPILLRERMEIICTRTQIRVTFPLWLHKAVGSPQVSLKDKSCAAVEQGSQLILEGQASACDSLLENDGRTTTIRNQVDLFFICFYLTWFLCLDRILKSNFVLTHFYRADFLEILHSYMFAITIQYVILSRN